MAERVVDLLEAVEVHEQHGQGVAPGQALVEVEHEPAAVAQAGELVHLGAGGLLVERAGVVQDAADAHRGQHDGQRGGDGRRAGARPLHGARGEQGDARAAAQRDDDVLHRAHDVAAPAGRGAERRAEGGGEPEPVQRAGGGAAGEGGGHDARHGQAGHHDGERQAARRRLLGGLEQQQAAAGAGHRREAQDVGGLLEGGDEGQQREPGRERRPPQADEGWAGAQGRHPPGDRRPGPEVGFGRRLVDRCPTGRPARGPAGATPPRRGR